MRSIILNVELWKYEKKNNELGNLMTKDDTLSLVITNLNI